MTDASALITVDELTGALRSSSPPVLLDIRWTLGGPPGGKRFAEAHIPGAQFVDLDRELAAPPGPGRHPLPEPGTFAAAMRRHGVSGGGRVVVYDEANGTAAARAWWLLRFHGHPGVRLLDGGFAAWQRAGGAVETGAGDQPPSGDFEARPGHMPVVDAEGAAVLATTGVLLDARSGERFRGEVEPVDRIAGRIPGARNLPTAENLGPDGRFLAPEALRGRFEAAGVSPAGAAATYCGSGVTAAHEVLAAEVAGLRLALYPGSWSEWITDPSRPVARGASGRSERFRQTPS